MNTVGLDVGGSGIKGAVVDITNGELLTERVRIATPDGFDPDDVVDIMVDLVGQLPSDGPIGVGFPAVVTHGTIRTNPTSHEYPGWAGMGIEARLADELGRPATVVNDADAAGLAEMRLGAGRDAGGVVMVFTFGTGIGSAIFIDGRLVPNVELGRIYLDGEKKVAEYQAAARIRKEQDLSWREWGKRLDRYFRLIQRVFTPDLIIIGGGASKHHERFLGEVDIDAPIVPATMRNNAGIVGAALAAHDRLQSA